MTITLDIPDRTAHEIEAYALSIGSTINDYCRKLVEDGYYIEKFGDLNEKLRPKENGKERITTTVVADNECKVVPLEKPANSGETANITPTDLQEEHKSNPDVAVNKRIKSRRRQLTAK